MTATENARLLRSIFDRMADGDTRALSDAMADDFRWIFPGDWSWSGSWGPKSIALKQLLRPLMAQLVDYRSVADLILAEGDRVMVQARGFATTTRGEPYHQTYCYIFRVADGRIAELVEHCDTALVERVLIRPELPAGPIGAEQPAMPAARDAHPPFWPAGATWPR